jgi:hypothetical protein
MADGRRASPRRPPVGGRAVARARRSAALGLAALLAVAPRISLADHAASFYPSYYPQEIRIDTLDPASAAAGWPKARVHAYVGDDPFATRAKPDDATATLSLRGYLVLTFDGAAASAPRTAAARCAAAARIAQALRAPGADVVMYPYPVTPYHADYLAHYDLARQAQVAMAQGARADAAAPASRVRAFGATADTLVADAMRAHDDSFAATLETVDLDAASADDAGLWPRAPWRKTGWDAAYRLYAGHVHGADAVAADAAHRRLVAGAYRDDTERVGLERAMVKALTAGCERVVLGYTLRREYFDSEYSQGVENVGSDSESGFTSAIFMRTVKLKDFPWNGWLRLGVAARPSAAWNPVGGFDDPFGRLVWLAIGDPALLPAPRGDGYIFNRVHVDNEAANAPNDARVPVPADAWRAEPGTGSLHRAGPGVTAAERVRVSAVTSTFHDGTQTELADLVYPYIVAARASAPSPAGAPADPDIARASAGVAGRLVAFRFVEERAQSREYGDGLVHYRVPVIDVYLAARATDPWQAVAAAPPWSTLPWTVVALMEEASARGIAALSSAEAARRGLPWLDLARDKETGERLAALVDAFAREGYRPAGLETLLSVDAARARWQALAAFHAQNGHFLDTNGPYRLGTWTADGVVLPVFRDASYPEGIGTFDDYAIPRRAFVTAVDDRGDRLVVHAEAEQVSRFQRSYELTRTAVGPARDAVDEHELPRCRYVIVAADGSVTHAGEADFDRDGLAELPLAGLRGPGTYTIMIALDVGANRAEPDVKVVAHRVAAARGRDATALR